MNNWLQTIHREDIYENFNPIPFQTEANNLDKYINDIFKDINQREITIIEVGSWKGSSAIAIAKYFLNKNIVPTIFCVDTWGGSTFHREYEDYYRMLNCKNGFPQLYQQFLSNVIHSNLQKYIIPVPHTSHDAARYLKKLGIECDICYIDANHEFDEVYQDIKDYYPMVKDGGIIFFDDYDSGWPGVVNAVNVFVNQNNLESKCKLYNSEFVIQK